MPAASGRDAHLKLVTQAKIGSPRLKPSFNNASLASMIFRSWVSIRKHGLRGSIWLSSLECFWRRKDLVRANKIKRLRSFSINTDIDIGPRYLTSRVKTSHLTAESRAMLFGRCEIGSTPPAKQEARYLAATTSADGSTDFHDNSQRPRGSKNWTRGT